MDVSDVLKLIAIVGTVGGGIYGTLFDFKKGSRITRHGKLAIGGIAIAGLISLVIQISDSIDAGAERMRIAAETRRQEQILAASLQVNADTKASLAELQNVRNAVTRSSAELAAGLDQQRAAAQEIRAAVAAGSAETATNLAQVQSKIAAIDSATTVAFDRIAKPLKAISFSYLLVFKDADQRFPGYYAGLLERSQMSGWSKSPDRRRMHVPEPPDFGQMRKGEAATEMLFEISSVAIGKDLQSKSPHLQYAIRAWASSAEDIVTADFSPGTLQALAPAEQGRPASIQLLVDFDQRTITKCVLYAAVRQIANDGVLVSEDDLLRADRAGPLALGLIGNKGAYLAEVAIHLRDGHNGTLRIPGKRCTATPSSYSQNQYVQCPLAAGTVGEFRCPEITRIQSLTLDEMTPD